MVKVALLVRLEAKPGREADVEKFLRGGLPLVQAEPATTAWFGIRLRLSTCHERHRIVNVHRGFIPSPSH